MNFTAADRRIAGLALAGLAAGIAYVCAFLFYLPGDGIKFVTPWYNHIIQHGRIEAFAHPFSNYTPPYLYLLSVSSVANGLVGPLVIIKLLGLAGAGWSVFAVRRLFAAVELRSSALWVLFLPSILLNAALLGQADTFWVAPCILALAAAIRREFTWVGVWSGLAFSIKAQAAFFAPFVIWFFLSNRQPLWRWVVPGIAFAAAMLPALLAGWPALDILTVYIRQSQWQPKPPHYFISNAASLFTPFGWFAPSVALKSFWIGYAAAILAVAAYVGVLGKRIMTAPLMVAAAALSAALVPYFLPAMHERFFILADVLAFCYAVIVRSPRSIVAAVLMQVASAIPVIGWVYKTEIIVLPTFAFAGAAIALLAKDVLQSASAGGEPLSAAVPMAPLPAPIKSR